MSGPNEETVWNGPDEGLWQLVEPKEQQRIRCAKSGTVIAQVLETKTGALGLSYDLSAGMPFKGIPNLESAWGMVIPCPTHPDGHQLKKFPPRLGGRDVRLS